MNRNKVGPSEKDYVPLCPAASPSLPVRTNAVGTLGDSVHKDSAASEQPPSKGASCQPNEQPVRAQDSAQERMGSHKKLPAADERIKVYWPEEKEWYTGTVTSMDTTGRCHVEYDDGDEEWLELANHKWELLPAKGSSFTNLHPKGFKTQLSLCDSPARAADHRKCLLARDLSGLHVSLSRGSMCSQIVWRIWCHTIKIRESNSITPMWKLLHRCVKWQKEAVTGQEIIGLTFFII